MKLKRFNYGENKRYFLYVLLLVVGLLLIVDIATTRAKYKITQSIPLAKGTIKNYKVPDLNIVAMYQENDNGKYQEISEVPINGYVLNTTKSYCGQSDGNGNIIRDNKVLITYNNGLIGINDINKKGTKCYIYFEYKTKTIKNILATKTISERKDFNSSLTSDTTGIMYKAQDNGGESYYFAGAPTDNWVKFAGFYWRIIRINGDGTIRMIYQGTKPNKLGENTQIVISQFNSENGDNKYVGYMYQSGQVHGLETKSKIKEILDNWYTENIINKGYADYINSEAGFCNDRTPSNGTGEGVTYTEYNGYTRLVNNKAPTFKCLTPEDNFKVPIGLITADEVAYAGLIWTVNNTSFYLYTNQDYWTMTPAIYNGTESHEFYVYSDGWTDGNVSNLYGVRPVINLNENTRFLYEGIGAIENPFIVF